MDEYEVNPDALQNQPPEIMASASSFVNRPTPNSPVLQLVQREINRSRTMGGKCETKSRGRYWYLRSLGDHNLPPARCVLSLNMVLLCTHNGHGRSCVAL
ncbi:hypothetical protein RB195_018056 [Necator americanus]|uniref:Uncharacterized protein n=1 Tax=Necator americanus TaxID=51031 RepID=A0ABR1CBK5_NECAM